MFKFAECDVKLLMLNFSPDLLLNNKDKEKVRQYTLFSARVGSAAEYEKYTKNITAIIKYAECKVKFSPPHIILKYNFGCKYFINTGNKKNAIFLFFS